MAEIAACETAALATGPATTGATLGAGAAAGAVATFSSACADGTRMLDKLAENAGLDDIALIDIVTPQHDLIKAKQ